MPDFTLEISAIKSYLSTRFAAKQQPLIVGVDEAGCGPWAGPVVAGAVVFPDFSKVPKDLLDILDDSKKMTKMRRIKAYDLLKSFEGEFCHIGFGQANEEEIDRLNIRQAALLAMKRAVEKLPVSPDFALIDGICSPILSCLTQTIKKGDGRSFSIAAASIIAKVTRDSMMQDLANEFPYYSWESNAGYGTKAHQEALILHGITKYHRKSFAPIARLIEKQKKAA